MGRLGLEGRVRGMRSDVSSKGPTNDHRSSVAPCEKLEIDDDHEDDQLFATLRPTNEMISAILSWERRL